MEVRTRRSDRSQDIIAIAIALFGMETKREDSYVLDLWLITYKIT